jgi:hypothetical protein
MLASVLGLAACATGPHGSTANTAAAPEAGSGASRKVCKEETTTGSNVPRMVCRTQEQADDQRDAARNWHNTARPSPSISR